ncbi:hypothetical protein ACIBQ1_44455 [Nonomuraea sp. NPDC050153]|uniref:hypothetical protein n=1 Tax=Nonomuraea sp. NPDC050153 TaxID=3364359 RepID=UPI00378745FA
MACNHIALLVAEQIKLRERRAVLTTWARGLLDDHATAMVWARVRPLDTTAATGRRSEGFGLPFYGRKK